MNDGNGQLKSFIERVERLNEEKKGLSDDIRDIFKEAESQGFDVKALRKVIALRKQSAADREEHEAIVQTYMIALGDYATTPLGVSAINRVNAQ